MTSTPPPAAPLSRRQLLARGAGLAAGVGLAAVPGLLRPPTARAATPTTGPVVWSVEGNGVPGEFRFWKRLSHDRTAEVGGGFVADAYRDAALAYPAGWLGMGLSVLRLVDRNLDTIQVWRANRVDPTGPAGDFENITWDGSRYRSSGAYPWRTTHRHGDAWPHALEVDNSERAAYDFEGASNGTVWPGRLRELHHYNDTNGDRQLWGSVYGESTVGYGVSSPPLVDTTTSGGMAWYTYQGPYNFVRALDTRFRSFQVHRGTYRRVDGYQPLGGGQWSFVSSSSSHAGTAVHVELDTGSQHQFTWKTR